MHISVLEYAEMGEETERGDVGRSEGEVLVLLAVEAQKEIGT